MMSMKKTKYIKLFEDFSGTKSELIYYLLSISNEGENDSHIRDDMSWTNQDPNFNSYDYDITEDDRYKFIERVVDWMIKYSDYTIEELYNFSQTLSVGDYYGGYIYFQLENEFIENKANQILEIPSYKKMAETYGLKKTGDNLYGSVGQLYYKIDKNNEISFNSHKEFKEWLMDVGIQWHPDDEYAEED